MSAPSRPRGRLAIAALSVPACLLTGWVRAAASAPRATPAAAAPPAARTASGFSLPQPARTVLKNGLTVLVIERHSIPLIEMQLLIKSGSTGDPPGKEGTASLVARLLRRGTKTRP